MKAIIIAGGRGERLRPLTDTLPKPMLQVAGKPILQHTLELLKKAGLKEFIFILGYLPEKITGYFKEGANFGVKINYLIEDQEKPLGTAGSLCLAKKYIDSTFIVTYADIIRELDVKKMINIHKKNQALATINTYKRFGPDPKSMIIFDKKNRLKEFIERPTSRQPTTNYVWANGSFYLFEPAIFNYLPRQQRCDFGQDIFPKLLKRKEKIMAFPTEDLFIDIGNKEKLISARRLFINQVNKLKD